MAFATAKEIRDAIASGTTSAVEVVKATLADIKKRDKKIGAFLETFDDDALAAAQTIDDMKARGESLPRLAGVPVAVKDCILVKGHVASSGSKILAEYVATYDATVVARLKAAGAIIVGRTNMDEFAMGSSTETSAFQQTKNPWDVTRVPGGSSGGSAAAVAAGFVPVALGSDTGGSVRQPAALCGITGLKPSYGRVSRFGLTALSSSLDQIGVLARSVDDAALTLEVIEGVDEKDATSVVLEEKTIPELMDRSLKGMRIGIPSYLDAPELSEFDYVTAFADAVKLLESEGAEITKIDVDTSYAYALPTYYIIQPAEASSNLARFDGMRYGTRAEGNLEESSIAARSDGFGREVKRRIILGTAILSAGYADAYYKKALAVRTKIRQEFDAAFNEVDVIMTPTSPVVAWKIGEKFDDPLAMYYADIFTVGANLAGIAGISVPCGVATDEQLPVGLQFLGGAFQDGKVLRAGAAYQSLTKWHEEHPRA